MKLFGTGVMDKLASRLQGAAGVAIALAAVGCPEGLHTWW